MNVFLSTSQGTTVQS